MRFKTIQISFLFFFLFMHAEALLALRFLAILMDLSSRGVCSNSSHPNLLSLHTKSNFIAVRGTFETPLPGASRRTKLLMKIVENSFELCLAEKFRFKRNVKVKGNERSWSRPNEKVFKIAL